MNVRLGPSERVLGGGLLFDFWTLPEGVTDIRRLVSCFALVLVFSNTGDHLHTHAAPRLRSGGLLEPDEDLPPGPERGPDDAQPQTEPASQDYELRTVACRSVDVVVYNVACNAWWCFFARYSLVWPYCLRDWTGTLTI